MSWILKLVCLVLVTYIDINGKKQKQARMNLKCDPNQALMLRNIFPSVLPGYHMYKKHWNTICLDGSIPAEEIRGMIDHSYALVVNGLKKTEKNFFKSEFRYPTL